MKNWKTTLFGIISALGAGLISSGNPTFMGIGQIISVLSPIGFGLVAKDSNVTGGTTRQQ